MNPVIAAHQLAPGQRCNILNSAGGAGFPASGDERRRKIG
jgi:hypothetical protein